ncbi:hypothetical protein [Mangrovihabitans endophyticus]|uniref:Uncharacterized protein n=1 Tax=Mangrovihabitans endophyticus TaxID=1751298 RepID=A0A8J3FPM8_9ACTN|nr:hypothetical protein [Mangrovihabitans endophyticus]GGK94000.1 hypothetical protein GCM10012284_30080 [Mangrovihabitans endophyticus]
MAGNSHRANCANAKNPGCVCSGCGGALHGWRGWATLAADTQDARNDRRLQLEAKVEKNKRTGALSLNGRNRQAFVDLARLDITDHLATTWPQDSGASPQQVDLSDPVTYSSDLGRLRALAETLMAETWPEISIEIDQSVGGEQSAREIKKQLADHTWCTLLVALVQGLEQINRAFRFLSEQGKRFLERALTDNLTGLSKRLAQVVAGIVVDKVWAALFKLLEAHFPLIGEDTLRVLRMLALFTCPSVEHHPEVYKHAARPLMEDGLNVISQETKEQLAALFAAWWQRHNPEANL